MIGASSVPIGRWLDDHSALFSVETITPSQYDDQRQRPLTAEQRLWQAVLVDALNCLRYPITSRTYREAWEWFTDAARTDVGSWLAVASILRIEPTSVTARIVSQCRHPRTVRDEEPRPVTAHLSIRSVWHVRVREHAGKPAAQRIVAPRRKVRLTVAGGVAG